MNPSPCILPTNTALDATFVEGASFADCYRVRLKDGGASVVEVFLAVFGHHPLWLKLILLTRHRVGSWFGLRASSTAEIMRPAKAANYLVGENIGPWPIVFLSEDEVIAGRDNEHLDFRLSVLKEEAGEGACAIVSTVCRTHNRFGELYLFVVSPFHKWGIQRLLLRAARAARL
jgi:hypothetical protein